MLVRHRVYIVFTTAASFILHLVHSTFYIASKLVAIYKRIPCTHPQHTNDT